MTIRTFAATAVTASALASAAATANHIDFITDAPFTLDDGGSIIVDGNPDNILGGSRYVAVDSVDAIAQLAPGDNAITFDGLGTTEATLTLGYGDFAGGDPLNSDFASMWDSVAVNFASVTGSAMLSVEFDSSAGSGISALTPINTAGMYFFAFDQPVFNGVDFSDIDEITFTLNATPGSEFSIESITREVIPAPGTAAIAGLFGVAAIGRRRR